MDKENIVIDGPKEAQWETLKEFTAHCPSPGEIIEYCRQNGLNERSAWMYLATVEDDQDRRETCRKFIARYIPASAILEGCPVEGVIANHVYQLCHSLAGVTRDMELVDRGYLSRDEIGHIHGGIKPSMYNQVSEVMRRIVLMADRIIKAEYIDNIYIEPTEDEAASIFMADDPNLDCVGYWDYLDDASVFLEIGPGEYAQVRCRDIHDEAEFFGLDASTITDKEMPRSHDIEPEKKMPIPGNDDFSHPDPQQKKMPIPGIAKEMDAWICGADDDTLSYVIHHHKLPAGHGRMIWNVGPSGNKSDAVRFWRALGMTPKEWNECFATTDGTPIKANAFKASHVKKSIDYNFENGKAYQGIYEPLYEHDLIVNKG